MIFVDTGAWYALTDPTDSHHAGATAWLASNPEPLVTTDYVVSETLTLLRARGLSERVIVLGELFFDNEADGLPRVVYLTERDIRATWEVFRQYRDKAWSFTDGSSKVVMERLGIMTAFAFDRHFRQFGSIRVVP